MEMLLTVIWVHRDKMREPEIVSEKDNITNSVSLYFSFLVFFNKHKTMWNILNNVLLCL